MDKLLAVDVDEETVMAEKIGTKEWSADCRKDAWPLVRATCNVERDSTCAVG